MANHRLLVIEDEPDIRDMLRFSLEKAGYDVVEAAAAEEAAPLLDKPEFSCLIVDWMLPGMSGLEFARRTSQDEFTQHVPIILLTAKGEEGDKINGFEAGVDDYITKPFSPKELIARIKAVIRRSSPENNEVLEFDNISLDVNSHRLYIDDEFVHIGPTEYRLLEFFMRNPERLYSREQLLNFVWGRNVYVEERTVDVHILRLRKLLAPYQSDEYIQTVRGEGYRFSKI